MNVVFLHIPKTGGMTFQAILASYFPDHQICPEKHNHLDRLSPEQLNSYRLFSGHFDRASCDKIPDPKKFITMLREPRSRVISTYNFWRAHKMSYVEQHPEDFLRVAKTQDLDSFLESENLVVRRHVENCAVRQLSSAYPSEKFDPLWADPPGCLRKAKKTLRDMHAFGLLEYYDQSVAYICDTLGFKPPKEIKIINSTETRAKNDKTMEPPNSKPITSSILDQIGALNTLDDELHRYAKRLFRIRCAKWRLRKLIT